MSRYDLAILNGTVIIPYVGAKRFDIGVRNGRIATLSESIEATEADEVLDAKGLVVLPGAVDSHQHLGIYKSLAEDAKSETASALVGGVTTGISYFRTGQHYLNKSGQYHEIFPEVLDLVQDNAHTDYCFHLAIMTESQLDEVDWLISEQGVSSFKYYMFYKGLNLAGDSTRGSDYTMAATYDLGHLYLLMKQVSAASQKYGGHGRISLSLHCEHAELIRVFMDEVKQLGLDNLEAYHRSRPPLSERLSMAEAVLLGDETLCPLNLLHLSSREAIAAGSQAKRDYPHLDIRLETTVHHLALTYDTAGGVRGKVNPPIRSEDDREALWDAVLDGSLDTVVSDHACCSEEKKGKDLWKALPGFGGSALLYPYLISAGHHQRGLCLTRIAELLSANPARAFGLYPRKGTIAVGYDADLTIVDLEHEQQVTTELLHSSQDFTPFAGMLIKGWPVHTVLRGQRVFSGGEVLGTPRGAYIKRPTGLHAAERQR